MLKETLRGPKLHRSVNANVDAFDEKTGIFTLSWASDAVEVYRASYFDEPWLEVLGLDPEECDLTRLNSGYAPLLWGHDDDSRDNTIGVVEKAWLDKGRGMAQVRMSLRDDLAGFRQDVQNKILTNVSVGYQVSERTLVTQNEVGPSVYRVTSWLPMEISLVSIPADETVGVGRSNDAPEKFVVTPTKEVRTMSGKTETPAAPETVERQAPAAIDNVPEGGEKTPPDRKIPVEDPMQIIKAERTRVSEITMLARKAEMGDEFINKAIAEGVTVDSVRAKVLDKLVDSQTSHRPQVSAGKDVVEKQRNAAEDWLLSRGGIKVEGKTIDLNGNEFRGMTLMDMAVDRLNAVGVSTRGMDRMEIAKRAITTSTSDFPVVLGNVFNKILLAAYAVIPDTWRQFCKVGSVSDFRNSNRYRMGTFGDLDIIPEGGEYKYGAIGDAEVNPVSVKTHGKMFSVTRQLLINDDLGALTSILTLMGRGAARGIEKDVYASLALNSGAGPTMNDTGNLFNSTAVTTAGGHANLVAVGVAPTVASIAAMSNAMQTQSYGGDFIDVGPSIFLGPIDLAEAVKVLNASQYDPVDNKFLKPNQVRGLFSTVIGSPRLTGTAWYTFADPNVEPVLEVDFLNGNQTPFTEQQQGWNVDGIEYKIRLDYGVSPVGFRGARKNPGA